MSTAVRQGPDMARTGTWTFTEDLTAYAAAVGELLRRAPAENTVPLTVIENSLARPIEGETYGWWTDADGQVSGAISHTPPHRVLLAQVPEAALLPLVDSGRLIGGIVGETRLVAQCAALWAHATGGRVRLRIAHRLFRLGDLHLPRTPDGAGREASAADLEFLVDCCTGFAQEASGPEGQRFEDAVRERLRFGGLWLWQNAAGERVAMAGFGRAAAGMVRVAPVYTVPAHRGRGYGSAVTAAVSDHLRHRYDDVVLFTDLTNPTSNSIYQQIGYRPVSDRLMVDLEP